MPDTLIETSCPSCGKSIRAGQHFAGKRATCPKCKSTFVIPLNNDRSFLLEELAASTEPVRRLSRQHSVFSNYLGLSWAATLVSIIGGVIAAGGFIAIGLGLHQINDSTEIGNALGIPRLLGYGMVAVAMGFILIGIGESFRALRDIAVNTRH